MRELDDKDKRIIELLIQDSRRPYHDMIEEIGLSESTIRKRVIKLKEDGIIEKFTISVHREDEHGIIAFLTIIPPTESEIKELLRETRILPQCEEVYLFAGQCGILVKVCVPEMTELDALIESFKGRTDVKRIERVCVVLRPIKGVKIA